MPDTNQIKEIVGLKTYKSLVFFFQIAFIPRVWSSNGVEEELPSDNMLDSLGSFETSRAEAVAVWTGMSELKKTDSLLILRMRNEISSLTIKKRLEIETSRERSRDLLIEVPWKRRDSRGLRSEKRRKRRGGEVGSREEAVEGERSTSCCCGHFSLCFLQTVVFRNPKPCKTPYWRDDGCSWAGTTLARPGPGPLWVGLIIGPILGEVVECIWPKKKKKKIMEENCGSITVTLKTTILVCCVMVPNHQKQKIRKKLKNHVF